ncbi:hypothetical protein FACS1894191_1700 [Clostridia bacterium]|nr:hypothetical protein FACS1894191_1700 [Clostridia bacterium]
MVGTIFGLWATNIIWCIAATKLVDKGKLKKSTNESTLAGIAFIAGLVALGFVTNVAHLPSMVVVILWAASIAAVGYSSFAIGNIVSGKTWLGD